LKNIFDRTVHPIAQIIRQIPTLTGASIKHSQLETLFAARDYVPITPVTGECSR